MCFFPKPIHITEKIAPVFGQSKELERCLVLHWDMFISRDWREVDSRRKEAKGRLLLWGGSSQLQGENMNLLFGKSSCWVVTNNTKSRFMSSRTWNGLWFLKEEKKSIESMLRDHRMARKPGEQGSHKGQGQNQVRLDWDGWRCVFFPFPPACTSVLICEQRTGSEGWSSYNGANFKNTQGANCKSNHRSLCLDSVYRNFWKYQVNSRWNK